jgi:hypothetical protein
MNETQLQQRIESLERDVAQLRVMLPAQKPDAKAWLNRVFGCFAGDPDYKKAMELGRKYRQSKQLGGKRNVARRKKAK